MSLDVKPTRSELLRIKKSIALAKSGHKLLKKKRDGLIMEFFEILNNAKKVMESVDFEMERANKALALAEAKEGRNRLLSVSLAIIDFPKIKVETKNIMGVVLPKLEVEEEELHFHERGPGIFSTSATIDEASFYYRKFLISLVKYAEAISCIYKMLEEIEKTKRKVNALEHKVIPELEYAKSFVSQRLEEMERENIFRLKRIKKKK